MSATGARYETFQNTVDIPHDLDEVYWCSRTKNKERLRALVRFYNGLYGYIDVYEYNIYSLIMVEPLTLVLSTSREALVKHAMQQSAYKRYIHKTSIAN